MAGMLKPGEALVVVDDGRKCVIGELLGSGGQGEVYRADWGGRRVAVKWYFPASSTRDQHEILINLLRSGPPDERFLWPEALVNAPRKDQFGYIMPLRESHYANIADLMARRRTASFRSLTAAGLHLADGYRKLHGSGFCYRDISHNNVFLNPESGRVLICDNDNVGPVDRKSSIGGTMSYMAPEVVRGESDPSVDTDRYSLAVLLFMMLMNHHPLEGAREASIRCFDEKAKKWLYGDQPIFIWDPSDARNRPDETYHPNAIAFWAVYPTFLKDLFTKAFTAGMKDPRERVTEGIWRDAMVRLHDSIVYCPNCSRQNFYDQASGQHQCWSDKCRAALRTPPRIRVNNKVIMLNHDSVLYAHNVDKSAAYGFDVEVAAVSVHPNDRTRWGLKNVTKSSWTARSIDGEMHEIVPGRSIALASGTTVQFGPAKGEIRL